MVMALTLNTSFAQSDYSNEGQFHLGLGLGLTYGGFGGRAVYNPTDYLGAFLGLGYNLDGLGYNFGLMGYLPSEGRVQAYLSGMYGTNAVIAVEFVDGSTETESYTGVTFGVGMMLKSKKGNGNYWDFGILLPIRSSEYNDDIDALESFGVDVDDPWPVLINVGYNINLN